MKPTKPPSKPSTNPYYDPDKSHHRRPAVALQRQLQGVADDDFFVLAVGETRLVPVRSQRKD